MPISHLITIIILIIFICFFNKIILNPIEEEKEKYIESQQEKYIKKIRKILVEKNFKNIPETVWELKRKELAEVRNFYFELLDKIEYLEKIDLTSKEKNKNLILEELKEYDLKFIKEYYFKLLSDKKI